MRSATVGAHLVVGPPGSGKTNALCERYVDLLRAGEQGLLFLVQGQRTARALRERILRDVNHSTAEVRVLTWHAFALSLLRSHFRALGRTREPGLLTGPEQFTLVREVLERPDEQRRWTEFRTLLRFTGFVEELREFVLRAQDAYENPGTLVERARLARRPDLEEAATFFGRYLQELDAQNVVDHANTIALGVRLLEEDDGIRDEVRSGTRHLFVDDYQNVTPAQDRLLRALIDPGGSVTVAGDSGARVFGFRGGAEAALDEFRHRYEPTVTELAEVWRGEPKKDAWLFDHLTEEADAIARECTRLHVAEGIGWGDVAVVVRRYGPASRAIARALEAARVPCVVVGENRPLADEPALRPMLELARAALRPEEREERLPGVLSSPVGGLDAYEVRALRRLARLRGTTLNELLVAPPGDLPGHLAAALRTLRALLDEVADANLKESRPDGVVWLLWDRLEYFREMVARGDEAGLDAVAAFARAIEQFADRRPGKQFADYLDVLEGVEFGPEPWNVPEERRPDAVRLMTAHHAVGTEFDAVILAGCVEGSFPDPYDKRVLIDLRDLLAPASPVDRRAARLAEEKRLFGVATSRARARLLLTAARETGQHASLTPSPFVRLAGLEWGPPPERPEALTRDEAEARARRMLRDPHASESARAAALDDLARLPGVDPDTWWYERDWTDPGTTLTPEDLRTSYSRLSVYDNCALQYLYQVELGLDPETTHSMLVGAWVHDIVDRCARGDLPATDEALIAALDEVWDPAVFESVAVEHRRRLDSEEMLRRWLRKDGSLDTLASEVEFEFPIDGAVMRGRIDRVVRLGGQSVRLIDYKTGRNAKPQDEIDEDLQLASYYLALKRDPNLSELGEPRYLELAYLGAFYQDGFIRRGLEPKKRPDYEHEAQARLEGFVAGIKAEEFAPSPDAECRWCSFKSLCPVWPEGDEVRL